MSIFAPRLRASTIRRSELAQVGPVFVLVFAGGFSVLGRPAQARFACGQLGAFLQQVDISRLIDHDIPFIP